MFRKLDNYSMKYSPEAFSEGRVFFMGLLWLSIPIEGGAERWVKEGYQWRKEEYQNLKWSFLKSLMSFITAPDPEILIPFSLSHPHISGSLELWVIVVTESDCISHVDWRRENGCEPLSHKWSPKFSACSWRFSVVFLNLNVSLTLTFSSPH